MATLYEFTSYSEYLRNLTQSDLRSHTVSKLAQFAGVQRPYLSNVLAGRSHLNTEQGYRLGENLGFDESAQNYFSMLIEHERASDSKFKRFLHGKILRQQAIALKLENRLERTIAESFSEMTAEYFSSWEFSALHILTSVPEFQSPEAMAQALRLPLNFVIKILDRLVDWKLVRKEKNKYIWTSGNVHVPSGSPFLSMHHRNWRERSVEDARQRAGETVHFTSVYSMSKTDYQDFKLRILDFLKLYNRTAGESSAEMLVSFNLDYFDLTF